MNENPYASPEAVAEEETPVNEYLRRMRWVCWGMGVMQWSMIPLAGMYGLMVVPEWEFAWVGLGALAWVGLVVGVVACDRCPKEVLAKRPRVLNGVACVMPMPLFMAVGIVGETMAVVSPGFLLLFWGCCVMMGLGLWQFATGLECEAGKKQSVYLALFSGVMCTLMLAATTEGRLDPRGFIAWSVSGAGLLIFIVLLVRTLETLRRWITAEILDKHEV